MITIPRRWWCLSLELTFHSLAFCLSTEIFVLEFYCFLKVVLLYGLHIVFRWGYLLRVPHLIHNKTCLKNLSHIQRAVVSCPRHNIDLPKCYPSIYATCVTPVFETSWDGSNLKPLSPPVLAVTF